MIKLPKELIVTGIPYKIEPPVDNFDQGCNSSKQVIWVTEDGAPARRRQFLFWEVAYLLMEASGISEPTINKYYRQVGAVLNRFCVDNNLDWVKNNDPAPSTIWINGLPYIVDRNADNLLKIRSLGGEVMYKDLVIRLENDMEPEITVYVTLHECTHAILFESFAGNLESRETIVEALAWQLYYFIRDNDLSKLKPEGV